MSGRNHESTSTVHSRPSSSCSSTWSTTGRHTLSSRHVEAEQRAQVLGGELEERPLVALEVGAEGEGGGGHRVEAEGVQHLDPHVDVAVGLGPDPVDGVQRVGLVPLGVEGRRAMVMVDGRWSVTATAGADRRRPAVRVGAVAVEEGQGDAVDAEAEAGGVGHLAVGRLDAEGPAEVVEVAVGRRDGRLARPSAYTGVTISNLSSSMRWLAASMRPGRPKNGSLATTEPTSSPRPVEHLEPALDPQVAVAPGPRRACPGST